MKIRTVRLRSWMKYGPRPITQVKLNRLWWIANWLQLIRNNQRFLWVLRYVTNQMEMQHILRQESNTKEGRKLLWNDFLPVKNTSKSVMNIVYHLAKPGAFGEQSLITKITAEEDGSTQPDVQDYKTTLIGRLKHERKKGTNQDCMWRNARSTENTGTNSSESRQKRNWFKENISVDVGYDYCYLQREL